MLDRPVIAINLLFLGIVAFLPYPTSLLGGNGTEEVPTIFYAVCISCAGLLELAVWLYASQIKDLLVPGTSPAVRRYIALRVARIPVVSCSPSRSPSSPPSSLRSSGSWSRCSG
jgi:uncharacterized membrane protein